MKVLIVGSGLAGITLSHQFLKKGVDAVLMASPAIPSSTEVATGMYNPVVFRRLNLSWKIEDLLPVMHRFIDEMEHTLSTTLRSDITFKKRIPNTSYAELWEERRKIEPHDRFMGELEEGFGPVLEAGMLDCSLLQSEYLHHLESKGLLERSRFDHSLLSFNEKKAIYQGQTFDLICFCEGPHALQNPYFSWLPFNPCQGEWVIIQTEEELTSAVINNKVNIIPLGECRYKLSSTYSWESLDWKTHEEAALELETGFKEVFDVPFNRIEQAAGVRPTVADRRPYLGRHPIHPSLVVFNGLGSKGVMLAPYFSEQLVSHLLQGTALDPEVDIQRHIKRFQPPSGN